ncbi:unnamed protein product [Chondrus crispus]|uniref:Uncharacterized protein n=1 Tax=Chondrus crispus TaxID=2769 RepID=R7Q7S8_CHOCR|nr:unnamed protein product [Chondrus crispus]XP_005713124.1 unnamed protein product [Chondrus crispus]XP_005714416.1 unnamed protein product [Chondrus crispus]XP_005717725.1 unnamed protein product [Chondrus crispus]CDF32780.1 unnamed protein product [Chondrus crispus]CDF33321.1 unnamed protein product [Chondrus crispus]CDF34597.1 unnamed protein product [Chondrus crispus]CDF37854.1 unnamed protein product [Chondrus crispus]|eukprot:XP_005712581.1 unnamed protein product [Chondrus crispus]
MHQPLAEMKAHVRAASDHMLLMWAIF